MECVSRLYDKKEWGIQQSVWWQRNSRNKWITKLALLVILSGYQRTLDHNFSICIQCSDTPSKQFCNLFVLLPFVSNFSTDWKRATQGVWKSHKKSHHTTLRAKRAIFTIWIDKSWLKMPIIDPFCEFLNLKLAVKQCH